MPSPSAPPLKFSLGAGDRQVIRKIEIRINKQSKQHVGARVTNTSRNPSDRPKSCSPVQPARHQSSSHSLLCHPHRAEDSFLLAVLQQADRLLHGSGLLDLPSSVQPYLGPSLALLHLGGALISHPLHHRGAQCA